MSISSQDLALLKSSSRVVHSVASPLLVHPDWRRLVLGSQRAQHNRLPLSPLVTSVAKQQQRSRHGSGSSVKSRTSLAATDSPDVRKKKFEQVPVASEPSEEAWHVALRRRFCNEYVEYLLRNSFHRVTLIRKPTSAHAHRGAPSKQFTLTSSCESGSSDSELGPVYLQRTLTGGVLLLELSFKRPYFTVSVYALDCTKNPQLTDSKTKRVRVWC